MPSAPAAECALVTAEMPSGSPRWFERSKQLVQRPRAARSIFGERLFGELSEGVRRALEQVVPTSFGLQLVEDGRCQGVLLRFWKLGSGLERLLQSLGHICSLYIGRFGNLIPSADGLPGIRWGFAKT